MSNDIVRITGIHHIAFIVSSERIVDFDKDLGFNELFRKNRDNDSIIVLHGFGIELEFFVDDSHEKRSNPEPLGLRHMAFKVDSFDETAEKYGINKDQISPDWMGHRYCCFADHDGNTIEMHE